MGVSAGLFRYPGTIFEQVKAEGTFYPPSDLEGPYCHLSRSWCEIHFALRTCGLPTSLALSGDYCDHGGLDGFLSSEETVPYLGFVSAPLVAEIANSLRGELVENVAAKLRQESGSSDYAEPFFRELVEFYAVAAAAGECIFICVA